MHVCGGKVMKSCFVHKLFTQKTLIFPKKKAFKPLNRAKMPTFAPKIEKE